MLIPSKQYVDEQGQLGDPVAHPRQKQGLMDDLLTGRVNELAEMGA